MKNTRICCTCSQRKRVFFWRNAKESKHDICRMSQNKEREKTENDKAGSQEPPKQCIPEVYLPKNIPHLENIHLLPSYAQFWFHNSFHPFMRRIKWLPAISAVQRRCWPSYAPLAPWPLPPPQGKWNPWSQHSWAWLNSLEVPVLVPRAPKKRGNQGKRGLVVDTWLDIWWIFCFRCLGQHNMALWWTLAWLDV